MEKSTMDRLPLQGCAASGQEQLASHIEDVDRLAAQVLARPARQAGRLAGAGRGWQARAGARARPGFAVGNDKI